MILVAVIQAASFRSRVVNPGLSEISGVGRGVVERKRTPTRLERKVWRRRGRNGRETGERRKLVQVIWRVIVLEEMDGLLKGE